jgi:PAS domain S-box-containing protein
MIPNVLIPLVASLVYGVLLFIVLRQRSGSRLNQAFGLYLLAMTIWSLGSALMHADVPLGAALFWNKIAAVGSGAAPALFFYFVQVSLHNVEKRKSWLYVGLASYLVFLIADVMELIVKSGYVVNGNFYYQYGPAIALVAVNWYFFVGFAIFDLLRQYTRIKDEIQRNRIRYVLLGISVVVLGTFTNFTPLGKYPVDIAANLINALLITHTIVRFELLDFNLVIRKALAQIGLAGLVISTYLVPILIYELVAQRIATDRYPLSVIFSLAIAVAMALSVRALLGRIETRVDRFFFRERYDAYRMVQELGQQMANTLDLDGLVSMLLERVAETLHPKGIGLLLKEEVTGEFRLTAGRGLYEPRGDLRWRPDHPISRWLSREGKTLAWRELETMPQLWGLWMQEWKSLSQLGIELFVPLVAKGNLVGILILSPKQSEEAFTTDDRNLLALLASQVAVSVENARLYGAVSRSQQEWEATFQAITDGICICDADLRILRANRALAQWLGATPGDLIGRRCDEVLHCSADSLRVPSDGRSINAEREEHILGGTFQISSFPLRSEGGQVVGSVQMFKDISERQALEEMWKRYEFIINTSKDLMALISPDYIYEAVNKAYCEAHRRKLDQIVGRSVADIWGYERFMEQIKEPLDQCLAGKEVHYQLWFDFAILGQRCFDVSYYPYHGGEGAVTRAVVISRDVTDRQQAQDALAEERALLAQRVEERTAELSAANTELARAARLKDEFLASMSHELRTPLTGILGLSEALQLQVYGPHNEKQLKALHNIEESGQHLLNLINDILDLSKIEAGKVELQIGPVALAEVCQASLSMIKEAAQKKKLKVSFSMDMMATTVQADSRRLKQMLVNLLSNAVKFTPEDGSVGLEVEGDASHKIMRLVVWDSGIGIAPEDMSQLFRPFVQLDRRLAREYAGTGLGLSLVQRMADMHGGRVTVESEPGKGSRFTITLPWAGSAEGTLPSSDVAQSLMPQQTPAKESPVTEDKPLILLAEDNEITLTTLSDLLRSRSFRVVVARNGEEAIEQARKTCPALVVMDIQMPGMDGLEAIRRIRAEAELAAIPIIALTALAMPSDRERCLAAGANDYMSKPLSLGKLVKAVENQLAKAQVVGGVR